jgi:biopolymer transport protein ExbD
MLAPKQKQEESLFINLTPMIDVILTLLIFFMAATKLYDWNEQKIDVQIPEVGSAKPLTEAPAEIIVKISQDGSVAIGDEPVAVSGVTDRLRTIVKQYPDQAVVIRGDGRAFYQKVAEVMAACEAAGVTHLAVSVRETLREDIRR